MSVLVSRFVCCVPRTQLVRLPRCHAPAPCSVGDVALQPSRILQWSRLHRLAGTYHCISRVGLASLTACLRSSALFSHRLRHLSRLLHPLRGLIFTHSRAEARTGVVAFCSSWRWLPRIKVLDLLRSEMQSASGSCSQQRAPPRLAVLNSSIQPL